MDKYYQKISFEFQDLKREYQNLCLTFEDVFLDLEDSAKIDKKNREKQGFALHDSNNFLVFEKAGHRP